MTLGVYKMVQTPLLVVLGLVYFLVIRFFFRHASRVMLLQIGV